VSSGNIFDYIYFVVDLRIGARYKGLFPGKPKEAEPGRGGVCLPNIAVDTRVPGTERG
jgi:hypothetical protein